MPECVPEFLNKTLHKICKDAMVSVPLRHGDTHAPAPTYVDYVPSGVGRLYWNKYYKDVFRFWHNTAGFKNCADWVPSLQLF